MGVSSNIDPVFIELEWIIGVIFILFGRLDGIVAGTVRKWGLEIHNGSPHWSPILINVWL